jgi:hypothetical protein
VQLESIGWPRIGISVSHHIHELDHGPHTSKVCASGQAALLQRPRLKLLHRITDPRRIAKAAQPIEHQE